MATFSLSKWYMDATDPASGATVICYWARLHYGPFSLSYSSVLDAMDTGGAVRTQTSWKPSDPPKLEGDRVVWSNAALHVDASWRLPPNELDHSIDRTLISNEDGAVRWHVVSPRCEGSIKAGGSPLAGAGYVERLEMTLPPWKLPIDELRWGRAILANAEAIRTMAWIDWRGPHPLTLVFINQHEMTDSIVTDSTISGGGRRLDLAPPAASDGRVLRDGPLVTSALAGAPGLRDWAPASILSAHEYKRLSRCVLTDPVVGQLHGWAIHEVVRFRDPGRSNGAPE